MIHGSLLAYVGPGPGLTMFWAFLALIGTIALAVLSLLLWPLRLLIKRLRGDSAPQEETPSSNPSPEAAPSATHSK